MWTDDFEYYLRELKKGGRKVKTEEKLRKHRSYFKKYLEGRELTLNL